MEFMLGNDIEVDAERPIVTHVTLECLTGEENKEGKPSNRRWFTLQLWSGDYKLLPENLQLCGSLRFDPCTTHFEPIRLYGFPAGSVGKARITTCTNLDWDAKFRIVYKVKRPGGFIMEHRTDMEPASHYKRFRWNNGPSGDLNTELEFAFLWKT